MSDYNIELIADSNTFTKNILYYKKVGSTNDIAKDFFHKCKNQMNEFLILADGQSKGRGKGGVHYFSPNTVGIYMSLMLIRPSFDLKLISMATALAIKEAIKKFINAEVKVKWPNDVLINDKKVCGILIESSMQLASSEIDYVVIGMGINVNNESFDPLIENIATSLKKESGIVIDRNEVVIEILNNLKYLLSKSSKELSLEYLMNLDKNSFNKIHEYEIF